MIIKAYWKVGCFNFSTVMEKREEGIWQDGSLNPYKKTPVDLSHYETVEIYGKGKAIEDPDWDDDHENWIVVDEDGKAVAPDFVFHKGNR